MSEETKIKIDSMYFEQYEKDYDYKLFNYQSENINSTERDFLFSLFNNYDTRQEERKRIFNLNNNDFFDYLIKNDGRIKDFYDQQKAETKFNLVEFSKKIPQNYIKEKRNSFAPFESSQRQEYYKIKFERLPPEQKTIYAPNVEVRKNKNLLYKGINLNLSERFEIAKKTLNIEITLRKLNIKESEKHRLLSFIMDCNIDTARHLMTGKYDSKDRDLEGFFTEFDLNK
jgi:hypothetical protein